MLPTRLRLRPSLVVGFALAILCLWTSPALAQNPVPGLGAGFGIEGNLLCNSPTTPPFNTANDWVQSDTLIDPIGCAVLYWDGTPVDPTRTFHSIDLTGNGELDVFASSNKVNDDPRTYGWKSGQVPQKDDMNNVTLHLREDVFGDLWGIMSGDRRATNGDSYLDFEFLQAPLFKNPGGSFTSMGADSGRTVGDLLVTIEFVRGGVQADFFVQRWEVDAGEALGFAYHDITVAVNEAFSTLLMKVASSSTHEAWCGSPSARWV